MHKNNLPIGVFDSGMGGLTVLKQLIADHPGESFIYLGDTARLPYGTKSAKTVGLYAVQAAKCLLNQQIKMLVIACNTASTALPLLKLHFPNLPIIGVVEPGARAVIAATRQHHVGVLATETTILSGIYQKTIQALAPEMTVATQACGLFVSLSEEGLSKGEIVDAVVRYYIEPLLLRAPECDALVLGCTHFPVFSEAIATVLPSYVQLINSAQVASDTVTQTLAYFGLKADPHMPRYTFFVTDQVERFQRIGKLFFGVEIPASDIHLIDIQLGDQE